MQEHNAIENVDIPGWSFSVTTRKSMSADMTGCANNQNQASRI